MTTPKEGPDQEPTTEAREMAKQCAARIYMRVPLIGVLNAQDEIAEEIASLITRSRGGKDMEGPSPGASGLSGWRPIETAPKDGTEVRAIWVREGQSCAAAENTLAIVHFNTYHNKWWGVGAYDAPTHWKPKATAAQPPAPLSAQPTPEQSIRDFADESRPEMREMIARHLSAQPGNTTVGKDGTGHECGTPPDQCCNNPKACKWG